MRLRGTPELFYYNLNVWTFNEDFRALAFESPATQIAATLMGATKINLMSDVIFTKEPHSPHVTPWHQDQPYWFVDGWQTCGMWIALDAVTLERGGRSNTSEGERSPSGSPATMLRSRYERRSSG